MLLYGAKLWSEKPIGKRRRQLWMERVERMGASTWVVGDGWLQSHDTNRDAGPGWEERLLSYQARREVKKV